MQAPLMAGRFFTDDDRDGRTPVVLVDENTARRYWEGRDPIGRRVRFGQDPTLPWITVVGVIQNIKPEHQV